MEVFDNEQQSALDFVKILYKRRWFIIGVTILGVVLSIGVTSIMPLKFYSFGIIYPSSDYGRSTILENPQFGHELEADRLMQILESEQIRDTIIEIFDLETYYEANKENIDWKQILDLKFIADVKFTRSKYMSIVISATMKDPELAADIVNKIIEIANPIKKKIFVENLDTEYDYIKNAYLEKKSQIESLEDSIYLIKDPGVSRNILYNHMLAISKDQPIKETYEYINSPELESLVSEYIFQYKQYEAMKGKFEAAKFYLERPAPKNYVVDEAKPSYKKESPSFRVNAFIGFGAAFLFAVLWVLFQSRYQKIRHLLQE